MCTLNGFDPSYQSESDIISTWIGFTGNPHPGAMVTGHYNDIVIWRYFNDGVRSDIPEGAMIKDFTITFENGSTATYDADGIWIRD